jgi:hypothetical protein
VDDAEYVAPAWVQASAVATCLSGGVAMSALLGLGLGDPTWAVSSGLGALFAAAVFEVRAAGAAAAVGGDAGGLLRVVGSARCFFVSLLMCCGCCAHNRRGGPSACL